MVLAMQVVVLALQGAFDLGLSALLDTLGTANELAGTMQPPAAAINVTLAGMRSRVCTAQGFSVPAVIAAKSRDPDAVLLPALGDKMPASLAERLTHRDVADAGGMTRQAGQALASLLAACAGPLVRADTSLPASSVASDAALVGAPGSR